MGVVQRLKTMSKGCDRAGLTALAFAIRLTGVDNEQAGSRHVRSTVMRVNLRPAVAADAIALTDLHLDVWDEAYAGLVPAELLRDRRRNRSTRIDQWRSTLSAGNSTTLVAWEGRDDRLVGFVSVGPGREEPAHRPPGREVMALYVRAETYGQGVGHALLNAAIDHEAAYLWVLHGNERASQFYRRQGFRYDGASKTESVGIELRMVRA